MDFTNEPYVRLFTRDTLTWKRFNWQAKAVLPLLLRKLDRAGTMDLDGMDLSGAIAVATELPPEVVDEAVPCLLKLGTISVHGDTLIAPRFLEAQECIKSDKLRAKEYRERKRSQTMAEPSQNVTNRHEENETSRPVTLGLTLPSEPSDPEREIAHAREAPEVERRNSDPLERFVPARRPVGEPPPNFRDDPPPVKQAPVAPSLETQVITAWQVAVFEKTTRHPPETKQVAAGAEAVAAWLRSNVREGETALGLFQEALKRYVAEDNPKLGKNSWPLGWLPERLPGYLAKASIGRPQPKAWVPPDYEKEQREAEERYQAQLAADPEFAERENANRNFMAQLLKMRERQMATGS